MAKTRKRTATEERQADVTSLQPHLAAPQSSGDTTAAASQRDRVAMRAYELYLARGGADGAALDDWLNAERELTPSDRTPE
jgi:hypothetical protein